MERRDYLLHPHQNALISDDNSDELRPPYKHEKRKLVFWWTPVMVCKSHLETEWEKSRCAYSNAEVLVEWKPPPMVSKL